MKKQLLFLTVVLVIGLTATAQAVPFTAIGTFDAGEIIPQVYDDDPLQVGSTDYYQISFTEPIFLSGEVSSLLGGDPDLVFYETTVSGSDASLDQLVASFYESGSNEVFSNLQLAAGDYLLGVTAFEYMEFGYTVDLSTTAVPIPSAVWLLASGLIGLVGIRRRYSR
jgi:hypothetical protein